MPENPYEPPKVVSDVTTQRPLSPILARIGLLLALVFGGLFGIACFHTLFLWYFFPEVLSR